MQDVYYSLRIAHTFTLNRVYKMNKESLGISVFYTDLVHIENGIEHDLT